MKEITAGGKTWRLGRVGFDLRLDACEPIRAQRRLEFKLTMEVLATLPEKERTTATLAAFDGLLRNVTVSMVEAAAWMASPEGELHQFWKSLQKANPAATKDEARELMGAMTVKEYAEALEFLGAGLIGA